MSFGLVFWFLFGTGSGPGKSRTYISIMQIPEHTISARSVLLMGAESSIHELMATAKNTLEISQMQQPSFHG
jgi:hypothetical protein